jgi:hypothetical protein
MNPSVYPTRRDAGWVFNAVVITLTLLILAAMVIPLMQGPRCTSSPRTRDSSNLRQIAQACLIYASDHKDQLPQTDTVTDFAAELARSCLNDATLWVSTEESSLPANHALSTVLTADRTAATPEFLRARLAFTVVGRGLHANLPATTPVAWTRGLQPNGTWTKDSPYGGDGGHIVFLGGNVSFYRSLASSPLARFDDPKSPTIDIREALPPDALIAEPTLH